MSVDFATLGLEVDTSRLRAANSELGRLEQAAAQAERSTAKSMSDLASAFGGVNQATKSASEAARAFMDAGTSEIAKFQALRASVDSGYASMQKFLEVSGEVNVAQKLGVATQEEANRVKELAASKYLGIATAAEQEAQAIRDATAATEAQKAAIAQQTSAYQSLRASVDPVYASSMRYEQGLNELLAAQKAGIVTEQEAARVSDLMAQRYLYAGNEMRKFGGILRLNRIGMMEMQAAGINSFQALAAGMDPFHVAMMESSQVVGAFVQGTEGGLTAIKAAFAGFLGPVSLAVAGLTALGGLLWYETFRQGKTEIDAAAKSLEALTAAAKALDQANKAASMSSTELFAKYGAGADKARALLENERQIAQLNMQNALIATQGKIANIFGPIGGGTQNEKYNAQTIAGSVERIAHALQIARPDAEKLRDALVDTNQAKTSKQVADALDQVRLNMIYSAHGLENMNDKGREFYGVILRAENTALALSNIDMSAGIKNASKAAVILSEKLGISLKIAESLAALGPQGFGELGQVGPGGGRGTADPRKIGGSALDWQTAAAANFLDNYKPPKHGGIKKLTDLQREEKSILEQIQGPLKAYETTQEALNELRNKGAISLGEYNEKLADAKMKFMQADEAGKFYLQTTQTFEQSMSQAIVTGHGLAGVLSNLAAKFAEAALQASLFGTGPLSHGGSVANPSSSLFGGIVKGLLGFASGTSYAPGGPAMLAENGPELVMGKGVYNLPRGAQVVPAQQTAAMMGGAVMHLNVTVNGARGNAEIRQMVAEGVGMGIDHFNSQVLPIRVNQIAQNPDLVGV